MPSDGITLVTGATGFIGSHVVHQLLEGHEGRDARVRVLVRTPEKLDAIGLGGRRGLEVARGDLLDPSSVEAALRGVTRVHHIAGYVSTARDETQKIHALNYDVTVNLIEAARASSVERIVYLASIFALGGGRDETPVREDVAYDLEDLGIDYFEAKRRAELYAREQVEAGVPIVFVYPTFCYGPGDVYRSSSQLLEMHLRGQLVAAFRGGHNAVDVRDAARTLIAAMDRGAVGERYLVGGANHTYAEIGAMLAEITGRRAPRATIPRTVAVLAGRLLERFLHEPPLDENTALIANRYFYYDDSKARAELGHTSRPLEHTLRDAISWLARVPRP